MDDIDAVFDYASRSEVSRFLYWTVHEDRKATQRFVEKVVARAQETDRTEYLFGIVGDEGNVIGHGVVRVEDRTHRRCHIGYAIHPDHWGKGIATEVAQLLVAFGFDRLDMFRIWAPTHPDNFASHRVLEKVGMQLEGCIRGHMLVDGQRRDSLAYAILSTDERLFNTRR